MPRTRLYQRSRKSHPRPRTSQDRKFLTQFWCFTHDRVEWEDQACPGEVRWEPYHKARVAALEAAVSSQATAQAKVSRKRSA